MDKQHSRCSAARRPAAGQDARRLVPLYPHRTCPQPAQHPIPKQSHIALPQVILGPIIRVWYTRATMRFMLFGTTLHSCCKRWYLRCSEPVAFPLGRMRATWSTPMRSASLVSML